MHPRALLLLLALALPSRRVAAQDWVPGSRVDLLARAAALRGARDADTLLAGWQAVASGTVRFAVVVGHGAGSVERVVRADRLRVEVYGEAPNRSKQEIVAWRDTLLAPSRIVYHRDHLGIVTNDFGPIIRLGQGEEVRDVPHPLSPVGLAHYEFRIRDTVAIAAAGRSLLVVAIDIRPRDPASAGAVGTLYLDAVRAAPVRFRFTFTAASYRDPTVEAISVELENALLDGVRWLPWRQAITIRREAPILALPLRTVLRGEWTIDDYRLGVRHPPELFRGPLVAGLRAPGGDTAAVPIAPLPGASAASDGDLEAAIAAATAIAPASRIRGMPVVRLLGERGLSSLLHVNRVQGVTPGAGVTLAIDDRDRLDATLGYGTADRRVTGGLALVRSWNGARAMLSIGREVRDVSGGAFGSGAFNSVATVVNGADAGSWWLRDRFVAVSLGGTTARNTWEIGATWERIASMSSRFTALDGTRLDNPALGAGSVTRQWLVFGSARHDAGDGWRVAAEAGQGSERWGRVALSATGTVAPVHWRLDVGAGTSDLPGYRHVVTGGRGTLVALANHAIGGRRLVMAEVALPVPVGVPAPGLDRRVGGFLPSRVTPFLAAVVAGGDGAAMPWRADNRVETVLGLRLDLWGPLWRLEAGWSPRLGRVGVALDAHPDWWPLL